MSRVGASDPRVHAVPDRVGSLGPRVQPLTNRVGSSTSRVGSVTTRVAQILRGSHYPDEPVLYWIARSTAFVTS